eukprot:scaffold10757_cov118-Isochrysis_galbana.AAC.3
MCSIGLLVRAWTLRRMPGQGSCALARWHVSEVRPRVVSDPATACVLERCSSGMDTCMRRPRRSGLGAGSTSLVRLTGVCARRQEHGSSPRLLRRKSSATLTAADGQRTLFCRRLRRCTPCPHLDETVALVVGEKVVAHVDGRLIVHTSQARVVQLEREVGPRAVFRCGSSSGSCAPRVLAWPSRDSCSWCATLPGVESRPASASALSRFPHVRLARERTANIPLYWCPPQPPVSKVFEERSERECDERTEDLQARFARNTDKDQGSRITRTSTKDR